MAQGNGGGTSRVRSVRIQPALEERALGVSGKPLSDTLREALELYVELGGAAPEPREVEVERVVERVVEVEVERPVERLVRVQAGGCEACGCERCAAARRGVELPTAPAPAPAEPAPAAAGRPSAVPGGEAPRQKDDLVRRPSLVRMPLPWGGACRF